MSKRHELKVTTPSDREIAMTRVFEAPRRLVWEAWTRPELLKRWLGVHSGWTLDVCEIDLRVGGAYRYVWRGPDKAEMGMGGVYREIVKPERMVTVERFDQAWYAGEGIGTLTLVEEGATTTLTLTLLYETKEVRDAVLKSPMSDGIGAGFDTLDGVLASEGR